MARGRSFPWDRTSSSGGHGCPECKAWIKDWNAKCEACGWPDTPREREKRFWCQRDEIIAHFDLNLTPAQFDAIAKRRHHHHTLWISDIRETAFWLAGWI